MKTCSVDGCERQAIARGLCWPHYQRNRRYGSPTGHPPIRLCSVAGCERKHWARGWCYFHYERNRKGIPLDAPYRWHAPKLSPAVRVRDGVTERHCPKCEQWYPATAYSKGSPYCRHCAAERLRQWRKEHPEYRAREVERVRAYRERKRQEAA